VVGIKFFSIIIPPPIPFPLGGIPQWNREWYHHSIVPPIPLLYQWNKGMATIGIPMDQCPNGIGEGMSPSIPLWAWGGIPY